jgi:hypothetical protein
VGISRGGSNETRSVMVAVTSDLFRVLVSGGSLCDVEESCSV